MNCHARILAVWVASSEAPSSSWNRREYGLSAPAPTTSTGEPLLPTFLSIHLTKRARVLNTHRMPCRLLGNITESKGLQRYSVRIPKCEEYFMAEEGQLEFITYRWFSLLTYLPTYIYASRKCCDISWIDKSGQKLNPSYTMIMELYVTYIIGHYNPSVRITA